MYLSKKEIEKMREKKLILRNKSAGELQRVLRGWFSRKVKFDANSRRIEISEILKENIKLQTKCKLLSVELKTNWLKKEEKQFKNDYLETCKDFHHLLSTKTVSGVMKDKTAFGVNVETQLKKVFKENINFKT